MMVQTEIGLLPEDWEVVQIGEVGTDYSYGVSAESILFDGINKYLRITDIDDNTHKYVPSPLVSPSFFCENHILQNNEIVVARTGASVGKSYIYDDNDGKLVYAGFLMKFRVSDENAKYVFYQLTTNRYQNWVVMNSVRSGQPGLNIVQLKEFAFPLPTDKTEQQNIASALSSIDKLIEDLGLTISKKRLIREGAMEELLSGKKRLPGFTEEWVEKEIGQIGKTYSGLSGKKKEDFGHGDAKYITFLNVLNNAILDISVFEAVDVKPTEKQNTTHYGDLFFNTSSETPEDVGTCACLNAEISNLYLNSFCFGYRLNDSEVYGNFLAYYFRTKPGREIMCALAQGATRYNLSKEYFNEIKVLMPATIKEQHEISYVLEAMTDEISVLQSEKAKYELIRSGMMEELLTGAKRLK